MKASDIRVLAQPRARKGKRITKFLDTDIGVISGQVVVTFILRKIRLIVAVKK